MVEAMGNQPRVSTVTGSIAIGTEDVASEHFGEFHHVHLEPFETLEKDKCFT